MKVNVKLSLWTSWKREGEAELWLHLFLTAALEEGELLAFCVSRCTEG